MSAPLYRSGDLNYTDRSIASSTGSFHGTLSDDSWGEADTSSYLNTNGRGIRDTARKYGRWSGGQQEPFAINTSALAQAFPGFSQAGSEASRSISIEASRSNKENLPPSLPRTRIGSMSAFHARVADGSESSFNGEERQPTATFPTKSSRFGSNINKSPTLIAYDSIKKQRVTSDLRKPISNNHISTPTQSNRASNNDTMYTPTPRPTESSLRKQTVASELRKSLEKSRIASQSHSKRAALDDVMNSPTPNTTQTKSFVIPDITEISRLVSGARVSSTSHNTKSRTPSQYNTSNGDIHIDAEDVPLQPDEKDIYISVDLLQKRVSDLEMERAESQRIIGDLSRHNYELEIEKRELEKQKRPRRDSALGESASEGESSTKYRTLAAEKTRLEGQVIAIQSRLDSATHTIANQEVRLKTNTLERDTAVTQLAEAWDINERLVNDNQRLLDENEAFKKRRAHIELLVEKNKTYEKTIKELESKSNQSLAQQLDKAKRDSDLHYKKVIEDLEQQLRHSRQKESELVAAQKDYEEKVRQQLEKAKHDSALHADQISQSQQKENELNEKAKRRNAKLAELEHAILMKTANAPNSRETKAPEDATVASDFSDRMDGAMQAVIDMLPTAAPSKPRDNTMQSVKSHGSGRSVRHTRSISDQVNSVQKHPKIVRLSVRAQSNAGDDTMQSVRSQGSARSVRITRHVPEESHKQSNSVPSKGQPNIENDTIQSVVSHGSARSIRSTRSTRSILKESRYTQRQSNNARSTHTEASYEEEPTLRPSEAPGIALVRVMNDIRTEIDNIRSELAMKTAEYDAIDPAFHQRKRSTLHQYMRTLYIARDRKSDQIYYLQDVLTGMEKNGQMPTEEEVDFTLHSLAKADGGIENDDEEDSDDEDLPWEGIETTTSSRRQSWS